MQTTTREVGSITVIDLAGNIRTNEDYSAFKNAIINVIETGRKNVVLNFKEVRFINSSGLGRLILAAKKAKENGGALKVASLSENLHELFSFTRLDSKIDIHPTEEAALKDFE